MPGRWRVVDLDERGKRPGRVVDPMEVLAVFVVAVVIAVGVVPRFLAPAPAPAAQPVATPAPFATRSIASAFALSTTPLTAGQCGQLTDIVPASSFGTTKPRAIRRIDASVSMAGDPWWSWCVAGARVYDDGIEVLGRVVQARDPQGQDRPRPSLRSATFSGSIEGFGALGPAELGRTPDGGSFLKLRAVSDNGRRLLFPRASDTASTLTLRLVAMAGPWSFGPVSLADGPVGAVASANGVSFGLKELRLVADGVATTIDARADAPDPLIVTMEWQVTDDAGATYRPRPDTSRSGATISQTFEPGPSRAASVFDATIRRISLSPLRDLTITLPLAP